METAQTITDTLTKKLPIPSVSSISKYHATYTVVLSFVPLACGILLLALLSVFAKLNLFFLEANGLILDAQVREAYFRQVEIEMFDVLGYLFLQVFITAIVSYVVMRWATAPFVNAQKTIETAMTNPENLRPASRWMSESPVFDRQVWLFSLRVKSGGENQIKEGVSKFGANLPFLVKFIVAFGTLSVSTGYVLSIIMDSVYKRIVDLALHLIRANTNTGHYFVAQQDILQDANMLVVGVALAFYCFLGVQISRYMATMLFVFSRAMSDDKFPLTLRSGDLYKELAATMNNARKRIG